MSDELIEIYHALKQGVPLVVATVIDSRGSTPRTTGSKMIVSKGGVLFGSIGGGAIEGDVIKQAMTVFETKNDTINSYDLRRDGNNNDLDLICGGYLEVMVEYVDTNRENEFLYGAANQKIECEQPFYWKTVIKELDDGVRLDRNIIDIEKFGAGKHQKASISVSGNNRVFVEQVLPVQTVYIVGAGHVSKEIATLTKQLGMKTVVFDDRASFANKSRFPNADGIHLCPEYRDIFKSFVINQNSYIIVVTRGHSYDKDALAQALKTGAGYIGMMGSRKKRNIIYDTLIAEGFDSKELDRVHCPIGLPIKAETPAELAVSIVAELINHRASRDFHF